MELKELIKIEGDTLFAPVVKLKKDNREIIFLGMYHVATANFFEKVLELLNTYDGSGFRVLYEDMLPEIGNELSEKMKTELIDILLSFSKELEEVLNLRYQTFFIRPQPHWCNSDLPVSNVYQLLAELGETPDDMLRRRIDVFLVFKQNAKILMQRTFSSMSQCSRGLSKPNEVFSRDELQVEREQWALQNMLNQLETMNVITYWGIFHLPVLISNFEDRGYVLSDISWLAVYTMVP